MMCEVKGFWWGFDECKVMMNWSRCQYIMVFEEITNGTNQSQLPVQSVQTSLWNLWDHTVQSSKEVTEI